MNEASPGLEYYARRYRGGADRWTRAGREDPSDLLLQHVIGKVGVLAEEEEELSVLDAGCGRLEVAIALAKEVTKLRIVAVDLAYDAIVECHPSLLRTAAKHKISFLQGDVMEFRDHAPFDVVLDFGLFHHLTEGDWPAYAAQAGRNLKEGGSYFLRCFDPEDGNWENDVSGGHVRKGYYCHYHTVRSLSEIFAGVLVNGIRLCTSPYFEHVESLYEFRRRT